MALTESEESKLRTIISAFENGQQIDDLAIASAAVQDKEIEVFTQRYTYTKSESREILEEQALLKQGAHIMYEASVCGVYLEENSVIGLRVITSHGIVEYGAKIVLDCTAEAYVAAMAG